MQMHVYGEDGLTLWALTQRFDAILIGLEDASAPAACAVFYRPSFGRSGGGNSPQFGEFDFIILSPQGLYLGESKWDRSSLKVENGIIALEEVQRRRHEIFRAYVSEWAFGDDEGWEEFRQNALLPHEKPIPGENSLLAANLRAILGTITEYYDTEPTPVDVLLYFHCEEVAREVPLEASSDFRLVSMEYKGDLGNYVTLEV